jgi:tRNA pseudouridine38-40 synthase
MRFKLILEYDGTRYAGWQLQKTDRSVQGELITVATKVFGAAPVEIYGSGRTDAGVHARGQVAHMEVVDDRRLSTEQIRQQMNDELSHDINILSVEKVHAKFHARFDAKERTYVYQISKRRNAFAKKYVWWVRDRLDLIAMRAVADELTGFHDFRSFGVIAEPGQSTTVELKRIDITEDNDHIYITLVGSHFLWKMVRRIVGTLVAVGRGKFTLEMVASWLKQPSKEPAKLTAPPSGLFLEKIVY